MFGRATIRLGIGPHSSCMSFVLFETRATVEAEFCDLIGPRGKNFCGSIRDST